MLSHASHKKSLDPFSTVDEEFGTDSASESGSNIAVKKFDSVFKEDTINDVNREIDKKPVDPFSSHEIEHHHYHKHHHHNKNIPKHEIEKRAEE